eukprot:gene10553-19286_t
MNEAKIRIREEELLKLVLDFLKSRNLFVSMRTLEKESGVVNSPYTDDILFLRELILDGDWDEVLMFAQPFDGLADFNAKQFKYLILKQKFLELLSLKSHVVGRQGTNSIEEVMKTLKLLEETCPSKEEYSNLCWLLTVPNLSERSEFKDWTLDNSRLKCFNAVLEVIGKVLRPHKRAKKQNSMASKDRLLQLIVKGLFYETSIEYCQGKATSPNFNGSSELSVRTNLLQGIADDYSANLLSWIKSLKNDVFTQPFEQVSVEIVLEKSSKAEKNLRHSIDVPKKTKNDEDIVFRSLVSLDLENRQNGVSKLLRQSPSTSTHFPQYPSSGLQLQRKVDYQNKTDKTTSDKDVTEKTEPDLMFVLQGSKNVPDNQPRNGSKEFCFSQRDKNKEIGGSQEQDAAFGKKFDAISMMKNETDLLKNSILSKERTLSVEKAVEEESFKRTQESTEDDLHKKEEKKRRESVMKKLEEYENRKKKMQMQLEQMSQGLTKSDAVFDEKGPEAPPVVKAEDPLQEKELSLHRHYVAAKDFVTDYNTAVKEEKPESSMKKLSGEEVTDETYKTKDILQKPLLQSRNDKQLIVKVESNSQNNVKSPEEEKIKPATIESKTPKNIGYVVSLSDGSGKISTSTPKAKKRSKTETPPLGASPVKPLVTGHNTPKAVPKKSIRTDTNQSRLMKDMPGDEHEAGQIAVKEAHMEGDVSFEGKENAPGDGDFSRKGPMINGVRRTLANQPQPAAEPIEALQTKRSDQKSGKENAPGDGDFSRKGPMINGVRRTLANQPQPAAEPIEALQTKRSDQKSVISKAPGNTKSKTDGDNTAKALESKGQETKPLMKQTEIVPPNKGPGPKIKMRDGTKVLVTELLKSREEIKNATANNQKCDTVDQEESAQTTCNKEDVELRESNTTLQFSPVSVLEDAQAIRAVCFHPDGKLFAVGSNSKILRICTAKTFQPVISNESEGVPQPSTVFKRNKYHKGSIYCVTWNPLGDIIATGSNDKSIKILRFDPDNCVQDGSESELNIHNGTVRELSFAPDKPAILISGGAGDGAVQITDCATCQTIGSLRGHTGNVMSVFAGDGDIVATGSTDNTLRLWDLRSHRCIDVILVGDSSPASVALSCNGSYLASGQEDGCILLYDISAGRTLQSFRLHQEDCRSVRFSPDSKYLLTGSYDTDVSILHTEGDLESIVPRHYKVACHKDKVIQCRWHPNRYAFLSSSADRTAVLWSSGQKRNLFFS